MPERTRGASSLVRGEAEVGGGAGLGRWWAVRGGWTGWFGTGWRDGIGWERSEGAGRTVLLLDKPVQEGR